MNVTSGLRRLSAHSSRLTSSLPSTSRSASCRQTFRQHSTASQGRTTTRAKSPRALAAALTASATAYALGAFYPPDFATLIAPRPAPPPPDPNLPSSIAYSEAIEEALQHLPLLTKLREAPDADEWYETRPYANFPEERRANSLTRGALSGPGKLAISPLLRVKRDESECVLITHFGRGLCGHDGIVHGGLIATVFDECLGRLSIMNFPEKVGVTATLTLNYKAPTRADQFVVMRCRLVELNGRKAHVEGTIEDLHGKVLATATAIFVQPKYAKLLNTKALKEALGEAPVIGAKISGGDPAPVPRSALEKS